MQPDMIKAWLLWREKSHSRDVKFRLFGGIFASILTPPVLAGLLLLLFALDPFANHDDVNTGESFGIIVGILYFFMILAYIIEWQTHGTYVMRRLLEIKNDDGGWYEAITRDRTWRYDAMGAALQWELLLFAPRIVFRALTDERAILIVNAADRQVAADILSRLVMAGHGVELSVLERNIEPLRFGRAVAYLLVHDIIGVGERANKIWLLTEARDEMIRGPVED